MRAAVDDDDLRFFGAMLVWVVREDTQRAMKRGRRRAKKFGERGHPATFLPLYTAVKPTHRIAWDTDPQVRTRAH